MKNTIKNSMTSLKGIALASLPLCLADGDLNADIVYSGIINVTVKKSDGLTFSVNSWKGNVGSFTNRAVGDSCSFSLFGALNAAGAGFVGTKSASGGPAKTFASHHEISASPQLFGDRRVLTDTKLVYYGFRAKNKNPGYNYGWLLVSVDKTDRTEMIVHSWAYETDVNATILAGQTGVPEAEHLAGGLALLALGAASLVRSRKSESTPCVNDKTS